MCMCAKDERGASGDKKGARRRESEKFYESDARAVWYI